MKPNPDVPGQPEMSPSLQELYDLLRKSEKFQNWNKLPDRFRPEDFNLNPAVSVDEKHFTPQELADMWAVSVQTIREIFQNEEGVLKIGRDGTRTRRRYKTLRIPESVVERVHTRLST